MHDRESGPLNDALDREIERMLAIEPSTAFESRVRARVAERHLAFASWHWWGAAMRQVAIVGAVVLLAVAGWRLWDASERVGEPQPSQVTGTKLHPSAPLPPTTSSEPSAPLTTSASASRRKDAPRDLSTLRPSAAQTATAAVRGWLPPVLVDPAEVAGMRALVADVRAGRFEMVVVSEEPLVVEPSPSTVVRAVPATTTPAVPPASDTNANANASASASEGDDGVDAGEPARAEAVGATDGLTGGPSTQLASAALVRPLVITPLTIEPLVKSVPDESEGVAE